MSMNMSNNLVGSAGEYYVCAELCRRGYLALITPKNNPLFDLVAMTPDGERAVSVQVKTRSVHNKQGWKFGKDMSIKKGNDLLFVVLVNLLEDGDTECFVYEYDILAQTVEGTYRDYLSKPKKNGTAKKDVDFRWHDTNRFTAGDWDRKNNWQPIISALTAPRVAYSQHKTRNDDRRRIQ